MGKRFLKLKLALGAASLWLGGMAWADFVAVGHPNYDSSAVGHLFVFGAEGATGTVTSNDGAMNQSFTIGAAGVVDIEVPSSQFLSPDNTVLNQAMLVKSASPISGYFLNRRNASTDMSYLLDLSALGTTYRVLGWQQAYGALQMSVTAVNDGTTVTITPAIALSSGQAAGVPFTVNLNAGQSAIYLASDGHDLSGSLIVASQPVAVFSGATCSNVPVGTGACDHLYTQLPPVNHFASEYVVPETARTGSTGNLVRILAATDNTQVTVNGVVVATLAAGQFHEIQTAHDLHIQTSQPTLVGQYLKGFNATGYGDPAFTFVPGTGQTLRDYAFTTPTGSGSSGAFDENYLNLAVPTAALASLTLNGSLVDTSSFTAVGASGYSSGRVLVPVGAGRIQASAPFVATLSGYTSYDSYLTIIGSSYSQGASTVSPSAMTPVPASGPLSLLLTGLGLAGAAAWRARRRGRYSRA